MFKTFVHKIPGGALHRVTFKLPTPEQDTMNSLEAAAAAAAALKTIPLSLFEDLGIKIPFKSPCCSVSLCFAYQGEKVNSTPGQSQDQDPGP